MGPILVDFSNRALIRANETNLYRLTPFFYDWPNASRSADGGVSWCVTDIPFPWCNTAFSAKLDADQADAAIKAFIDEGDKRDVPLFWFMTHDTRPADLGDRLRSQGFKRWGDSKAMAMDLNDLRIQGLVDRHITIRMVDDSVSLAVWCRIAAQGFGMPLQAAETLLKWFSTSKRLNQPLRFFLAYRDDHPVATSALFTDAGVAGIYFVATVGEARRKGIGTAVTLAALADAKSMGFRIAILQASQMGIGIYRNLGFFEHGEMGSYVRMNHRVDLSSGTLVH